MAFLGFKKRGTAADAAREQVEHAHGIAAVEGRALRHVADAQLARAAPRGVEGDAALVLALAEDALEKRRLARAVGADQGDDLPAVHVQVHVVEDRVRADADGQILNLETARAVAAARVVVGKRYHPSASPIVSMLFFMAVR
jgi:hypothetical protein